MGHFRTVCACAIAVDAMIAAAVQRIVANFIFIALSSRALV